MSLKITTLIKKSRIRVIDTGFCYFRKINSKMFYNLHNFS